MSWAYLRALVARVRQWWRTYRQAAGSVSLLSGVLGEGAAHGVDAGEEKDECECEDTSGEPSSIVNAQGVTRRPGPDRVCPAMSVAPRAPGWVPRPPGGRCEEDWAIARAAKESRVCDHLVSRMTVIVRGPIHMGKSTFIDSSLRQFVSHQAMRAGRLDIAMLARAFLRSPDTLVATMAAELGDPYGIEDFEPGSLWEARLTHWMEKRVLKGNVPFVLSVDGAVDFEDPDMRKDARGFHDAFMSMLCSWSGHAVTKKGWSCLRIVLADPFALGGTLDAKLDQFSMGAHFDLQDFDEGEILGLAKLYGLLAHGRAIADALRPYIGGHPYLICCALHDLCQPNRCLHDVIHDATEASGVFAEPLERLFAPVNRPGLYAQILRETLRKGTLNASRRDIAVIAEKLARVGILRRVGRQRYCIRNDLFKTYLRLREPWISK